MPLINCEIDPIPTLSTDYFIFCATRETRKFAITNTNCRVLVATSSTQDNAKLLQQLESGQFTIYWNEYR